MNVNDAAHRYRASDISSRSGAAKFTKTRKIPRNSGEILSNTCLHYIFETYLSYWGYLLAINRPVTKRGGGARGAVAGGPPPPPPPPTGPKGPQFDTQYPSLGVQSVKLKFKT